VSEIIDKKLKGLILFEFIFSFIISFRLVNLDIDAIAKLKFQELNTKLQGKILLVYSSLIKSCFFYFLK
jgi:hypothetical protein